jgi:acyl-CoA reductase-like NAD-dependent aldehyde dehydrogenase
MSERLPEYVEEAIGEHEESNQADQFRDQAPVCEEEQYRRWKVRCDGSRLALQDAIHRYAAEERNKVLEEAAKACEQAKPSWNRNDLAERIRALKTKERADGA